MVNVIYVDKCISILSKCGRIMIFNIIAIIANKHYEQIDS